MGQNQINIALLGLGRIGQMHALNLINHPEFNLKYTFDIDKNLNKKFGKKYKSIPIINPNVAFNDKSIKCIFIATSTKTHLNYIDKAVRNGVKNFIFASSGSGYGLKEEKKVSYHPGKNGSLFIGENKIASFGELHPNILKKFKIKNKTCICELYFTEILNLCRKKSDVRERFFKSNFQSSIRDFSFDIEKNLKSQDIVDSIKKIDNKIISDVKVFDNYESSESRSIAIEVVMQSDDKTLTEQEISDLSERIIQNAKKKFNAKLR